MGISTEMHLKTSFQGYHTETSWKGSKMFIQKVFLSKEHVKFLDNDEN